MEEEKHDDGIIELEDDRPEYMKKECLFLL